MKRKNIAIVIIAELLAISAIAVALSVLGMDISLVKAILISGFVVVVIPTSFMGFIVNRKKWSNSSVAGLVLTVGVVIRYYYGNVSIISTGLFIIVGVLLMTVPWNEMLEKMKGTDRTAIEEKKGHIK